MAVKGAEHIRHTKREWRQLKRRQLREIRKAVDAFRLGCAYVPGYRDKELILAYHAGMEGLEAHLAFIENQASSKNWGH